MELFSARTPSRYLLLFAEGPSVLFEFPGCAHLAADLPTVDVIRDAEGLSFVSSGGDLASASQRFARDIDGMIKDVDASIDRIGLDRFPLLATDALRRLGYSLVDSDEVLAPARAVKLPIEITFMREAMRRVEPAVARLEQAAKPGMTESELWAEFHYEFLAREGRYVCTRLFQSGANTFPYFNEAGNRKIAAGDLLALDTDVLGYEGYAVDFSRTFVCGGQATATQRRLYGLAREQLEHNASLLAPGRSFADLASRAWPIPEAHQESRYYCIGHGLGMAGEFPNIPHAKVGEPYPLNGAIEPGMVICIESYIGERSAGQGVKLEDQFLITELGVERMSAYEFDAALGG
jgi:Xaa-Pro dipeptidase